MPCFIKPCNRHISCPGNIRSFCDTPIVDGASLFYNAQQECTYTCVDGTVFHYVAIYGEVFSPISQAVVDLMAAAYACYMAEHFHICLGEIDEDATEAHLFTTIITYTGDGTIVTWTVTSGSLPDGLTLVDGVISGIPTTSGTYTFTVTATDEHGSYAVKEYTITVVETPPLLLEDGSWLLLEDGSAILME